MANANDTLERFMKLTEKSYDGVYQSFRENAYVEKTELCPVNAGHRAFVVEKSPPPHKNSVEVRGALRINNLPYQRTLAAGASKHASGIDVLMDSLDIYKFKNDKPKLDESFLYCSTVRLAYFRRSAKKWKPLLCIRYDFAKSTDAHPIFHAQLENGIPSSEVRKLFKDIPEVDVAHALQVHTNVRFPTANVVGATALLSLAADHLPLSRFPVILKAVRDQAMFSDAWRCDCSSLDGGLPPKAMLASGWYSSRVA